MEGAAHGAVPSFVHYGVIGLRFGGCGVTSRPGHNLLIFSAFHPPS